MYFLDEFPELLTLGSFPGVGDPLKHFRAALQRQTRVAYVITGSAISATEHIVRDHESPLFLQFRALELHPFTPEDTQALTEKLVGRLSPAAQAAIHTYTFGHPFYVTALAERVRELAGAAAACAEAVSPELVSQAFVLEALENRGQIYGYCRYLYDISLQKARGYGVLKALLQILAIEDGLALSEVASRVRRQASAARDYLRRLMEVDLLVERQGRYFYADPVFRYWVAQTTKGVAIEGFPRQEELKALVAGLAERFARDFDRNWGAQRRAKCGSCCASWPDEPSPAPTLARPPRSRCRPSRAIEPYRSPDGQTEIDALAENGERWAVEVKWRQKRVGRSELEQLLTAAAEPPGASLVRLTGWLHPRRIDVRRRERHSDQQCRGSGGAGEAGQVT